MVFVVAIAALLAFCGHPGRRSAQPQAARPCQAAQLRALLAGDSGYASEEQATVGLVNESPQVCALEGYPLLSFSTLAHRPFPFGFNDYHGDARGSRAFGPSRKPSSHAAIWGPTSWSTG